MPKTKLKKAVSEPVTEECPPDGLAPPDNPRTRQVLAAMHERKAEIDTVISRGSYVVNVQSTIAREIVQFLEIKGMASLGTISREVDLPTGVVEHFVTALERAGRVKRTPRQYRDGTPFIEATAPLSA